MRRLPNDPSARSTARILKVNHAGEYGAIRIYRAQLWMAKRFYPDLVPFLAETLGHELRHASLFRDAMPSHAARPCRIMALWGNGGLVLGFGTALLGRQGIWICTAAVEGTVHRHLEDQLVFLHTSDPQLHALIDGIKDEELGHLHHAENRIVTQALWARALHRVVAGATEAVIWLSTWGDSNRMKRELKMAKRWA